MKTITLFCFTLILFLYSCGNQEPRPDLPYGLTQEILQQTLEISDSINHCFGKIDTSMNRQGLGCQEGFYGQISGDYILRIDSDFLNQNEFYGKLKSSSFLCNNYNIKNKELGSQLLIFEKDSAHLNNICSDLIYTNLPKQKRIIPASDGHLKIVLNPISNNSFIKIDSLVFIDTLQNNQEIKIKDIVLWDIKNWGIPG